jgi:hypothetical protein
VGLLGDFFEAGIANSQARNLLDYPNKYLAKRDLAKLIRDQPERGKSVVSSLQMLARWESGARSDLAADLAEYGETLL